MLFPILALLAQPAIAAKRPVADITIVITLPAYRLDVMLDDSLLRFFRIAIGDSAHPTPTGSFTVDRVEWDPWWVPPSSEWAEGEEMMPPGPRNPMGRVRLPFRPLYFIHGSPVPSSIGRAESHGCVRLSNPDAIALARLVLEFAAPNISRDLVDRMARSRGRTTMMRLERPVRLEIR